MKSGASTTRGMAFSATMSGSKIMGQLLPAREEEPDRDAEQGSQQEPDDGLLHRHQQVTEDESARDPFGDLGGQHAWAG